MSASRAEERRRRRSGRSDALVPPSIAEERRAARAAKREKASAPRFERPVRERGRLDSLTGLRSFAILSVLVYHLGLAWLPSGHMGVVVFLVLTGYLVTSSLARRKRETGGIGIPSFWGRRLLRLWPAMAVMVVVVVALCVVFNHVLLTKARPDVIPALGFFTNIAYILRGSSYFEALGAPSPLTHLWYLGIDLQFCLVWPLALSLVLDDDGRASQPVRIGVLVLALASALAMAILYKPLEDPSRVYYGPDTRAFSLLIGAWLALVRPMDDQCPFDLPEPLSRILDGRDPRRADLLGLVSLAGIIAVELLVPARSAFLYRGGMLLVSVLSAALIAALTMPEGQLARLFALPPFTFIGERSYSLYLWHYPLILLMGAQVNTAGVPAKLAAVAVSLFVAELFYELVEKGFAQGLASRILEAAAGSKRSGLPTGPARAGLALALAVLLVAVVGSLTIADETIVPEGTIVSTGDAVDRGMDLPDAPAGDAADEPDEPEEKQDPSTIPSGSLALRAPRSERKAGVYDPVIVADSVIGDAADYAWRVFPNAILDSYVGRRPDQAAAVLADYLDRGVVGNIVILDSFSNVPCTDEELDAMVEACGDRKVYLVNVFIPGVEQDQINDALARCAERHENATLIDWYSIASANADEYIYEDGEHLRPAAQPVYVDMVARAIAEDFVEAGGWAFSLEEYENGLAGDLSEAETRAREAGQRMIDIVGHGVTGQIELGQQAAA